MENEVRDSSDGEEQPAVDGMILTALANSRNRMFALKLEQRIQEFMENPGQISIKLPPVNSFYRLLAHKIAEHYGLGHSSSVDGSTVNIYKIVPNQTLESFKKPELADIPIEGVTDESSPKMTLLSREKSTTMSPQSTSPSETTPPKKMVLLKNNSPRPPSSSASSISDKRKILKKDREPEASSGDSTPVGPGTFESRERAYMEARARIFKDHVESDDTDESVMDPLTKALDASKLEEAVRRLDSASSPRLEED